MRHATGRMTYTLYKVLDDDLRSCYGGKAQWEPGVWMPPVYPYPYTSGYHLYRGTAHLIHWLGPQIYTAETRGEIIECEYQVVAEEARVIERVPTWNERTARLFACDCAEHVLHLYERAHPDDTRPREAIAVARRFANGDATAEGLAAARVSALAASVRTVKGVAAVEAAAGGAAWATDGSAAYAAANAALAGMTPFNAAEPEWQARRLCWYLEDCP